MTKERVLYIELGGGSRYLASRSDVTIERVVYSTGTTYLRMPSDDEAVVSRRPRYEILDLPAQTRVHIEDIDPFEEGMIFFTVEEVQWATGEVDRDVQLKMRQRQRARAPLGLVDPRYTAEGRGRAVTDPEPPLKTVEREKWLVDAKPSGVVRLDAREGRSGSE